MRYSKKNLLCSLLLFLKKEKKVFKNRKRKKVFRKKKKKVMLRRFQYKFVPSTSPTTVSSHCLAVALRTTFGTPLTSNNQYGDPTERSAPLAQLDRNNKPKRVPIAGTPVSRPQGQRSPRRQNDMVLPAAVVFMIVAWIVTGWYSKALKE